MLRNRAADRKDRSGLAPWQLKRVMARIKDDLSHDLSRRDLADLVGLSPFHLCRAFVCSTGLPPHKWRLRRRIERAERQLELTDRPVTDIALDLGFATSQHFAAAFKRATSVSPSTYRASRRGDKAPTARKETSLPS
jgi:AraC family transcriptional regulator